MPAEFPVSLIIKAIDKVTAPLQKINAQVQKINAPFKRLNNAFHALAVEAGFEKLIDRSQRLGKSIAHVGHEAIDLAKRLGAFGLLAGGALFGLAKSTADAGDSIAKTAAKLGIGTQRLQEWRFAAEHSGVEQDTLDQSLQRLSINLAQAAAGGGDVGDIFKALSISVKNSKGQVRSLDSVLPALADKFSKIKSASLRNAIALKLFGKEGVNLGALLQRGSKGLTELADESHALGAVLSDDAIKSAVEFKDVWDKLKTTFVSVRNAIGTLLLPVVRDLMQQLQQFLVQNREKIVQWTKTFIANLPEAFRQAKVAFLAFKQTLSVMLPMVKGFVDVLGGIKGGAIAVALIIGGKLVLAVLALANAFRALLLVMVANPILLAITVIAAAAFLLIANWQAVKTTFLKVIAAIKQGVQVGVEFIQTTIERVFTAIKQFLNNLNPFAAIQRGVEKVQSLVGNLRLSQNSQIPAIAGNHMWEPAWGAGNTIHKIQEERTQRSQASVNVTFDNAPPGTRVYTEKNNGVDLSASLGMHMAN